MRQAKNGIGRELTGSIEDCEDGQAWQEAELSHESVYDPVYGAILTTKGDDPKGVFAYVDYHMGEPIVNIPLNDATSIEGLVRDFYDGTTFFGEIDQELFSKLATNRYKLGHLMALLNRESSEVEGTRVAEWFYKNFSLKHMEKYGNTYLNSYGIDPFTATIESFPRQDNDTRRPETFAHSVNDSFPHLTLSPFSKDDYLKAVQASLPFLPKDWEVAEKY